MPTRLSPQQIENLQQLQATVTGPDGATRMFIITGILQAGLGVSGTGPPAVQQTQTFTVLVGPVLSRRQFVQAVATAAVARTSVSLQATTIQGSFIQLSSSINGVDADWDDESGQVELSIEVSVGASGVNNNATVQGLTFQVTILAALDQ